VRTYRRFRALRCRRLQVAVTFASLALVQPTANAKAQRAVSGMLSGVVVDSGAGMGIVGVEISIDGTTFRTLTDERGEFRFPDGTAGPRTLHFRRLGFRPATVAVSADGSAVPITVRLAPSTQYLAPVQVRAQRTKYSGRLAGYYERLERRTHGQFITRAELERERPAQLTDMLQRSPGIRITRGRPGAQSIRMRGRDCRPLVWIDGAPMSAGDVDLDSFSPASLEGIEMYMGAGNAPPRYQAARGQSECGTILLWSRGSDTEPRAMGPGVAPEELETLIASLAVYASEEVDVAATLDSAGAWEVPYPPSMRASGVSGTVIAEFVVDTLGRIEGENFGIVSSTHPLFSAAVREAARTTVFRPAIRRGRKVRHLVRQPFEFHPLSERP
jgi:TonB family protein